MHLTPWMSYDMDGAQAGTNKVGRPGRERFLLCMAIFDQARSFFNDFAACPGPSGTRHIIRSTCMLEEAYSIHPVKILSQPTACREPIVWIHFNSVSDIDTGEKSKSLRSIKSDAKALHIRSPLCLVSKKRECEHHDR